MWAVAILACSRGSLTSDAATGGPDPGTGAAGQTGVGGTGGGDTGSAGGGAAGQTGVGGTGGGDTGSAGGGATGGDAGGRGGAGGASGGNAGSASSGAGGGMCSSGQATCTLGVSIPLNSNPHDSCAVEGATCEQFVCHDWRSGYIQDSVCCRGQWFSGKTCPPSLNVGDSFECGDTRCVVGQSYCYESTQDLVKTCKPLCAAGDCTCFCGQTGYCDFDPPGESCVADQCHCRVATSNAGVPLLGGIQVWCQLSPHNSVTCGRDPSTDRLCTSPQRPFAWYCTGPRTAADGCTELPDSVVTPTCGGDEIHYVCCSS